MRDRIGGHWLAPALIMLLLLTPLLAVARPQPAAAAGVVSECTEAALRNALTGGGDVTFSCSGTITLTSQLEITQNVTIDGKGQVTLDGQRRTRLFVVNGGVKVELIGLTLRLGNGNGQNGGAIYNSGVLTIIDSTLHDNQAKGSGGAIFNNFGGDIRIIASTLTGNIADIGGAILNSGGSTITTIVASTLSYNDADNAGGAIFNDFGTLTLNASTLINNVADNDGAISNNGPLTITGSILGGFSIGHLCAGSTAITSNGYNVASDASCNLTATGDLQNADPLLGTLQDNGGATLTMLPQAGSPALGRVPNALCATLSAANDGHDQRGAPRPRERGLPCDSGAVESGATVAVQVHAVHASASALDEGERATLTATASGPADAALQYSFGCPDGDVGPQASPTAECFFAEPGEIEVPVTVSDAAVPNNRDTASVSVTVRNLPPMIEHVAVEQDRTLLNVHVDAEDPGGGALTYRFECAGSVIGPQLNPQAMCDFGSQTGELTVLVEVSDSQGASAAQTVQVELPASICGWRAQRPVTLLGSSGWECLP